MYVSSYATRDHLFALPSNISPYHSVFQMEVATARHAELLREQAQIQRFVRINPLYKDNSSINTAFDVAYQREVRQKQLRIAKMLKGDRSFALQQQNLRKKLIEQQHCYQSMLQQMEMDRHYLLPSRKTSRLNSYKPNQQIFAPIDNTFSNNIKNKNARDEQGSRSIKEHHHKLSETFESVYIKKNSAKTDKKQKLLREYEKNSWSNHSEAKHNQEAKNEISKYNSFRENKPETKQRLSLDFHKKRSQSAVEHKSERKVMFDLASNIISTTQSPQNKNQVSKPKQAKSSPAQNQPSKQPSIKEAGQRKINNRIRLSQTIYRDSELKNIKHELIHLINTYQNEVNLRHSLKTRINNEPKVIEKYNIVVQIL